MKNGPDCDCGLYNCCNGNCDNTSSEDMLFLPEHVLILEVQEPAQDAAIKNLLHKIKDEEAVISLNEIRINSGLVKIAAKHKPNNPKLWKACLRDAKKRFRVCPSAYCNAFAAKTYKKKGGTWRTVSK